MKGYGKKYQPPRSQAYRIYVGSIRVKVVLQNLQKAILLSLEAYVEFHVRPSVNCQKEGWGEMSYYNALCKAAV